MALSVAERRLRQRLKDDFAAYSERCLNVRTKAGRIAPLILNAAQVTVHAAAEAQRARTGRVRMLVLKARQTGVSTYVQGRFYWLASHRRGARAFILAHREQATDNLFAIVRRFHAHCPATMRPSLRAANARGLEFGLLETGYRIGTARAQGVARAETVQLFHGSEVAFWPDAADHAAGALQAVPDEAGSEIWLESTAAGPGGYFYNMWRASERNENDFRCVFVPWFALPEYAAEPPADFRPPPAFAELGALYGLSSAQVHWAWRKNGQLAAAEGLDPDTPCWRFRREYPASAEEAFRSAAQDSFVPAILVARARAAQIAVDPLQPLVIGCDFARGQRDRTAFFGRRGRLAGARAGVREAFHSDDTLHIAGRLANLIEAHDPALCALDAGGGGAQVYDVLAGRGFAPRLVLVNFAGRARDERTYANRRAEIYGALRAWLADAGGAAVDDDDALAAEILAPGFRYNANQQIVLEEKERVRARLGLSPDEADALALTFAEAIAPEAIEEAAPPASPASWMGA